jgi:outer membrane lipoprotein SlyB
MRSEGAMEKRAGALYVLMIVAAIAVTVFSALGIAAMMGWIPSAASRSEPAAGQAAPASADARAPARAAATSRACAACGVVEAIRLVEVEGAPSGLGAVAGGVVGGILGNQIGRGSGRAAMTVVGAGAGAYAGHEIEKRTQRSSVFEIRVRMEDGSHRVFHERAQPALRVGQKVRATESGLVPG